MPEPTSLSSLKPDKTPEGRYIFYLKENKSLKARKLKLVEEIKKLSKVFYDLNIAKEKVKKGVGEFSMGRFKELEGIGSDLMEELQVRKSFLDKESAQQTVDSVLLEEMSEYFGELGVIAEATTLSNASKSDSMTKDASNLARQREDLNKLSKEVMEMQTKAVSMSKDVEKKHEEAEKLTTTLNEDVIEEKRKISKTLMDISNKETELKGREDILKIERKRLNDWDTKLKDKEQSLKRTQSEMI